MIKCIIVDDEPLGIDLIADHVNKHEKLQLIKTFENPIKALHFIKNEDIDLIFLDVQMPELSGMQFIKINAGNYKIILTTAYDKYALEAYNNDVIDYLLKPISYERFCHAITKIAPINKSQNSKDKEEKDYIFVKSEYKIIKIKLDDILYLKSMADYVIFQLKDTKILTLDSMKSLEQVLPQNKFVRVHKSYIVPIAQIDYIKRNRIIIGDEYIPIGQTYQEKFWNIVKK